MILQSKLIGSLCCGLMNCGLQFYLYDCQYINYKLIFFQKLRLKMENGLYKMNSTSQENDTRGSRLKRKPMFDQRGNLQNGVRLSFQKGFGFNQNSEVSSAQSIDDNKIIYILGKQIVLYDMLSENQKVIDSIGQEQEITCFKYYKNLMLDDNILYAIYSANKIYPTLMIKNFSKGNTQKYVMSHLQKEQKIVFLDLVNDYKHICVISELEGNFRFSQIDLTSKEVLSSESIYFKVKGVIIPFSNDKIVILYSSTQLYVVQLGEQIKPIPLKFAKIIADQNIVQAITTLENDLNLYLVTNKGNLYYLSVNLSHIEISNYNKQFLGTFETVDDQGNAITKNRMPSSLCCNEYNILIGYHFIEQFTLIKVCSLSSNNSVQTISFSCPFLHKIVKMTFAHQTMAVCVIVQVKENDKYDLSIPIQSDYLKQKGQIKVVKQNIQNHKLPPGKVFPVIFNLLLHDTLVETLRSPIQSVLTSTLFVQKILDICLLPTKKIFLILSAQRKIKAIKYEHITSTSFERMLAWEFIFNLTDNPTSLDVHPLTFNVAVGLKEGLKLFVICSQGLKTTNIQFPMKNCETVRYSKYGHKLVAGSLNQMIVINPYENKVVNTIQFNSGYMVRELSFLDKDLFIQGVFANGSSMIMNSEGQKLFQVWNKNNKCICSAFDSVFDIMAVSYPDSITKFYRDRGSQQFAVMWTYPYNITKFLIVNEVGTIFMGTSLGKVRAHQWPFTDSMKFSKYFTEIQLHSSAITELRVTHDYSLLISGAQDGSIFISRINAISQGIPVNDAQVLSSFKSSYKNYKTLYYLQHYLNTSSSIENAQEQIVGQLQSDKSDFDTEYNDIIQVIQEDMDVKLRKEQQKRNDELKAELEPLQQKIQKLNELKMQIRQQISNIIKALSDQSFALQEQKLVKIRQLYKETDKLNESKAYYTKLYKSQIDQLKNKFKREMDVLIQQCRDKEEKLMKQCQEAEGQYRGNLVNYRQLMKEQTEQGEIYKSKMIQEMERQLQKCKEQGQQLRKRYNKLYHDNNNYQQKTKYFQQLTAELQIDKQNAIIKNQILKKEEKELSKVLIQKDRQIFNQQKQVKELLTGNINNYTHQEYLKHKKQELIHKAKYLEAEIAALDKKYNAFQQDFTKTNNDSKQLDLKIEQACQTIKKLKEVQRQAKQKAYLRRYKQKEIQKVIKQTYHKQLQSSQLKSQLSTLSKTISLPISNNENNQILIEVAVGKRDHLIKQVVNTNNLRKIDDSIRRTIMIKLNRQTVSLTCEVNQLRKQKKTLSIKLKEIQSCIKELRQTQTFKQNNSVQDIIPANISIIRKQASKHHSSHKLLPFQAYHNNKSFNKYSTHSKHATKECDESTQLPSLMKHNISVSNESSGLYGVEQIDDQMIQ